MKTIPTLKTRYNIFGATSVAIALLNKNTWTNWIRHMTDNHDDVEKESYVESGMKAVGICYICNIVFYSQEDLDKHEQLEIPCLICKVCMAVGSLEFDYCAAME